MLPFGEGEEFRWPEGVWPRCKCLVRADGETNQCPLSCPVPPAGQSDAFPVFWRRAPWAGRVSAGRRTLGFVSSTLFLVHCVTVPQAVGLELRSLEEQRMCRMLAVPCAGCCQCGTAFCPRTVLLPTNTRCPGGEGKPRCPETPAGGDAEGGAGAGLGWVDSLTRPARHRGHQASQHGGADGGDHGRRVPPAPLQHLCLQQQQRHHPAVRHAHLRPLRPPCQV